MEGLRSIQDQNRPISKKKFWSIMVEIIYRRNELHCTVKVTIFNVWFQPILRSFGQLSLRKERDQPRMLKNHLSFIEPRNYSTENMDHIMDGKCAVSDSQALSFYSVEPLYKDLYKALFKCFVSKILCNKKKQLRWFI